MAEFHGLAHQCPHLRLGCTGGDEVGDLLGISKTRAHGLIQEALMAVRNNLGVEVVNSAGGEHERDAEAASRKAAPVDG